MKSEITNISRQRRASDATASSIAGLFVVGLPPGNPTAVEFPSDPQCMTAPRSRANDTCRAGVVEDGADPVAVAAEQSGEDEREFGSTSRFTRPGHRPPWMRIGRGQVTAVNSRSSLPNSRSVVHRAGRTFQSDVLRRRPTAGSRSPARSKPVPRRWVRYPPWTRLLIAARPATPAGAAAGPSLRSLGGQGVVPADSEIGCSTNVRHRNRAQDAVMVSASRSSAMAHDSTMRWRNTSRATCRRRWVAS